MIGSRRVASNATGAATLLLRTVPHTTVDGAAVDTCGLQPVTPAVTADVATTAARALMLEFQRHLIPVRRGAEHSGSAFYPRSSYSSPSSSQAPRSVGVVGGSMVGVADRVRRPARPLTRWPRAGQFRAEEDRAPRCSLSVLSDK